MGFFSRRKDKESALSSADMEAATAGTAPVDVGTAPVEATQAPSEPAPSLGIGQAPAGGGFGGGFSDGTIADEVGAVAANANPMMALMALMTQHAVDLRSQPMEVREAVAADCRAQGVDMQVGQSLNITDPQQIHTVVEVLKKHGLLPANVNVN
jgi:hypothetical protein